MLRVACLTLIVAFVACSSTATAKQPQTIAATRGVVVSVSKPGSQVGVAILKQGGNAVDAAVATALAMAVTYPPAGNIGGGGFMMIHPADDRPPVCIDYREVAPAAAARTMFSPGDSRHSRKIVGVPGTVRGLELAHRKYGKLPWKQLVAPAILLAKEGFPVDAHLAESLNAILAHEKLAAFTEFVRVFSHPDGKQWKKGDRLQQPDLAKTLEQIAAKGADGFYTGPVAALIAAEMKRGAGEGLITTHDLAAYRAKVRKPIHTTFRGHDVYGPPPPSSGGITLALMLNVLDNFDLRERGRWSPVTNHLIIETMKRAYLDRARHLGDADFVKIPAHLTTKQYASKLAAQIDRSEATPSEKLAPDIKLAGEGTSTTHFSVIDSDGMAVSNTYTLENSYGSRVVVQGGGFLLNNEMGDFNWKPGHTDRRGRIGTEANTIQPGKRMLSSQCPTLVARNGRVVLVTGSPGGRTIINTSLAIVLNVLEFEMPLADAVAAPRLHHQWLPDLAKFEGASDERHTAMLKQVREMGHTLNEKPYRQGDAHSIYVHPKSGRYLGVADYRRSGFAAGY